MRIVSLAGLGVILGCTIVDPVVHNPCPCLASSVSCQTIAGKNYDAACVEKLGNEKGLGLQLVLCKCGYDYGVFNDIGACLNTHPYGKGLQRELSARQVYIWASAQPETFPNMTMEIAEYWLAHPEQSINISSKQLFEFSPRQLESERIEPEPSASE